MVCLWHRHRVCVLSLEQWFLTGGGRASSGGVKKFLGGREPLHALQHRKILNGNVPFKRNASANFTPLCTIWFNSGGDGSRG